MNDSSSNPQPVDAALVPRFGAIPTFMRLPHVTDPARLDIAQILRGLGRTEEAEHELRALIETVGEARPALAAEAWTMVGTILARDRATWNKALSAHRKAEQTQQNGREDREVRAQGRSCVPTCGLNGSRAWLARPH